MRVGFHVAAVVHIVPAAAHFRVNLLGVKDGIMLELGPAAQIGVQLFPGPGFVAHKGGEPLPLLPEQGIKGVKPAPVEVLHPGLFVQTGDKFLQFAHILAVARVVCLPLGLQDGVCFRGAHGRGDIQRPGKHSPLSRAVFLDGAVN